MNESEVVALCLAVRKKKFERSRAVIARCKKMVEQNEREHLDAKAKQDEFKKSTPQLQENLFSTIRGKPLSYLELDTYFAELEQIYLANNTLHEMSMTRQKSVEHAKAELDKHLLALQEIRKKYEKMQEIEETILSERRQESIIEGDDYMDDIALTLGQSSFRQNV